MRRVVQERVGRNRFAYSPFVSAAFDVQVLLDMHREALVEDALDSIEGDRKHPVDAIWFGFAQRPRSAA